MRKILYIVLTILLLFIVGCSNEEPSPNDQIKEYTNLWNQSDFEAMYTLLTEEARNTYSTEEFIDRYEKIYEDLEIENLQIKATELSEEEENEARDQGT